MQANTFGKAFSITTFGESHGKAIGLVVDGCPPGLALDMNQIKEELVRRRPGQSHLTTPRHEKEDFEILSGLFEGLTTGHPISIVVRNNDQKSEDYLAIKDVYRPSHADYTYQKKYGIRDYRGGGRSSARETVARVVGGAIAKQVLGLFGVEIKAFVGQVGEICLPDYTSIDYKAIYQSAVRCPDLTLAAMMEDEIQKAKEKGDSLGGVIGCHVLHCPVGLGEPVFDKLEADLAKAMLSIPASKGFDIGAGFGAAAMYGSRHNDAIMGDGGKVHTQTNHSGGVQGGISNGENIHFRVAFKPVSTIALQQDTIDRSGNRVKLEAKGRHDPCVVPRAVPIVEAMAALVLCDHLLRYRGYEGFAKGDR